MEKRRTFLPLVLALVLCLCFIGWTAAVAFVDVQAIGPEGSQVGLAAMNAWARRVTGVEEAEGGMRPFWYKLTNGLGYVALIVALLFALLGLCQLVRRRGLGRMDRELLMLGLFYVLLLGCYVLFEKVFVNYRPVMITAADGLEASYPSSHTMLACFIFATAMMQLPRLVKSPALRGLGKLVCAAIIAVAVALSEGISNFQRRYLSLTPIWVIATSSDAVFSPTPVVRLMFSVRPCSPS